LSEINEEVTINDRSIDKGECLVLQAADTNNLVFHDNSRNTANEEVLLDNGMMMFVLCLKMLIGITNQYPVKHQR
jgi:hypothetical protein